VARHDRVAARYAKAIFDLLKEEKKIRAGLLELETIVRLVEGHADLAKVFNMELFPAERRRQVVEDLAKRLKLSTEILRTLLVLSDQRRLGLLATVVVKLRLLLLESSGIIPLNVETASDLGAPERQKTEKTFSQVLGKKVEANYVIAPPILGGLRVTAKGRTYDGTISGWLSAMREQLAEGRA